MVVDRITMWLADENEHYVELLKRYIRSSNYGNKLHIAAYTDVDSFKQIITDIRHDAIVLVSPLFMSLCAENNHPSVILLRESHNHEPAEQSSYVYKYRPLNQLLDQVLNMYYERMNGSRVSLSPSGNKPRIIAVYCASGGSGVTTISTQLAHFMASLGKRVFYLNLETIHGLSQASKDNTLTRFAQVLYMIRSGQPLSSKLHQLLQSEHPSRYDMFHPARYSREWLEYEREDMQLLLSALRDTHRYEFVVMDAGSCLYNHIIGALEYCDELLWIIPERQSAIAKAEFVKDEFRRISTQLYDQISKHTKYVLQHSSSESRITNMPSLECYSVLPFVAQWQQGTVEQPPLSYRQALIRLMGMTVEEELVANGTAT
jgi:septum formation inhibitor-activating ATPase MinD